MSAKPTPYPDYIDSGIEWLGELPTSWDWKRLKYLAPIVTEKSTERKNPIGLENIESWTGRLQLTDSDFQGDGTKFSKGDLLFGKLRPYLAKVLLADRQGEAVGDFHVLRPTRSTASRFLQYQLLTNEFISIVDGSTYGAKMPRASWEFMGNLPCAAPNLAEQLTIATFLDHETAKIDTLIEKQQQLIKLLKEKRQAVISHAVTKGLNPDAPMKNSGVEWLGEVPDHWNICNMEHVLNAIGDLDHYMPKSTDDGIPYVMTGDLEEFSSSINFEDCKKVSYRDYLQLSKKIKTSKGDIIMARYATIGTASYVDIDREFLVSYSCVTIKPNKYKAIGIYLFYYLSSFSFMQGVQSKINTSTQGNVGTSDIKKVKIALPGLEEQKRIIDYLKDKIYKIECLSNSAEKAVSLMRERKAAIISAAVTGKIDVRNWTPQSSADMQQKTTPEPVASPAAH